MSKECDCGLYCERSGRKYDQDTGETAEWFIPYIPDIVEGGPHPDCRKLTENMRVPNFGPLYKSSILIDTHKGLIASYRNMIEKSGTIEELINAFAHMEYDYVLNSEERLMLLKLYRKHTLRIYEKFRERITKVVIEETEKQTLDEK